MKLVPFIARNTSLALFVSLILAAGVTSIRAQSTTFTYTGQLIQSGAPANGPYDMTFSLFPTGSGGGQIGSTITVTSVPVAGGAFSVSLDFGNSAFLGGTCFLEISVRPSGPGTFQLLLPRSSINSAPYAIRAKTAGSTSDPVSSLSVTNSQLGITNPSTANLPPAAIRGEATSTLNSNAGVIGIGDGTTGLGVIGVSTGVAPLNGQGNAGGVIGIATATSGKSLGVSGQVSSPDGVAVQAQSSNGAALFEGGNDTSGTVFTVDSLGRIGGRSFSNPDQSFVADRFGNLRAKAINVGTPDGLNDTFVVGPDGTVSANSIFVGGNGTTFTVNNGVVGVNGSFTVTGSLSVTGAKQSIVKLPDGQWVALSAMESPGTWFEDFGTIRLRNGRAVVRMEATFAQTANVGAPYMVYVSPGGNCRGLYVTRKTADSFEVREIGGGRSNIEVDYRIVAKRKGYENVRFAPVPSLPVTK